MNKLSVGFIIDPLDTLKAYKDSSVVMMLDVLRRGGDVYVVTTDQLSIEDTIVFGEMQHIFINEDTNNWFTILKTIKIALHELDMVWMRVDPPVNDNYLHTTYLLDNVIRLGGKVFNSPQGIRDANEKLFAMQFSCIPDSIVTTSKEAIVAFIDKHSKVVIKSLDSHGGKGVFLLKKEDLNNFPIIEMLTNRGMRQVLVQQFIQEINKGDKRVLMIDGEPVSHAIARIPHPLDLRGNIDAGASSKIIELSESDLEICHEIGPVLKEKGLIFVGLDIIGDYCTEINVTSPTCIREFNKYTDQNAESLLLDFAIDYT